GSTSHYLEALARGTGARTGLYTSPHLQHVTERVRIDGEPVPATELADALDAVLAQADAGGMLLSFFEALTAAAVRIFGDHAVDVAVLEVGLGGRLDATTAVPVDATVLTHIELEHTDLLGPDIESIATEKAHIMRPGAPAWVTPDPRTDALFAAHAGRIGAVPRTPATIADLRELATTWSGTLVEGAERHPFTLHGASRFELAALALAFSCLHHLLPHAALPLTPVPRPELPGRFEVHSAATSPWILDGAHTEGSARQVATELRRRFPGRRVNLLFGAAAGKRWTAVLSELLPLVDRVLVTPLPGIPCEEPAGVVAWLHERGIPAVAVSDPESGWAALRDDPGLRLVAGSFYLVGAVRQKLDDVRR
ncbi:MAG: hypothetical protein H6836_09445, partial [Planctomycetes bacterium]|nr:hypothetical protein [Planctomycetota bacterium]